MESQPQNPEFRINPENFHPWNYNLWPLKLYNGLPQDYCIKPEEESISA